MAALRLSRSEKGPFDPVLCANEINGGIESAAYLGKANERLSYKKTSRRELRKDNEDSRRESPLPLAKVKFAQSKIGKRTVIRGWPEDRRRQHNTPSLIPAPLGDEEKIGNRVRASFEACQLSGQGLNQQCF